MKKFIQFELGLLHQRLAEIPSEWIAGWRKVWREPWRIVAFVAIVALWIYLGYYSPFVIDVPYWVRYGSFPRR
jgi:hypothetical protein